MFYSLSEAQKAWLKTRGGRTSDDVVVIDGEFYVNMVAQFPFKTTMVKVPIDFNYIDIDRKNDRKWVKSLEN